MDNEDIKLDDAINTAADTADNAAGKIYDISSEAADVADVTADAVSDVQDAVEDEAPVDPKSIFGNKAPEAPSQVIEKAEEIKDEVSDAAPVAAGVAAAAEVASESSAASAKEIAAAAKKEEKAAAKEAAAKAKKEEKALRKDQKKMEKRAARRAKIDACPREYKPVSTSKYFWFSLLSCIPVIGLIFIILTSIIPRNKNVKNFERSFLAYRIILYILILAGVLVAIFFYGNTVQDIIDALLQFKDTVLDSISFG